MTIAKRTTLTIVLTCLVAALIALTGCGSNGSTSSSSSSSSSTVSSSSSAATSSSSSSKAATSVVTEVTADDPYGTGTHTATVTVKGYEPFQIVLDADQAPVSVSNFCNLANDGFYDGLTFYRFVSGFCMQGGSSNNSAEAANDGLAPIVGEFSGNGVENALADDFQRGTVAMARSNDPDSATSTFFVTLASGSSVSASLDGMYAAFGTIDDEGMAIIDQIVADYLPNVTSPSMGTIDDVDKQAVIESIVIDK